MNTTMAEYFIGKACTVFTVPINRNLKEEQLHVYFLGIVEKINETGILLRRVNCNVKSFYQWEHIVGIAEEEVLTSSETPVIKNKQPIVENKKAGPYVDPASLSNLAKQLKVGISGDSGNKSSAQ